ncbi:tetratricopeptide repeat protein [Brachyspira catarrhinii]|uniref:Tetratricopeptide repeat protein n=1 Tax=Brachyspira catarrhinii TaxID=2528966 RepID=A0ABY2TQ09_9SPIR|nr:tetratricopeptide repeat protein [Brachyspira catarrhinii]
MKIKKEFILFILFFLLIFNYSDLLYPQNFAYNKTNIENAYRYYNSKNYRRAAELFEYEINNSPVLKIEYFETLSNIYMYQEDYSNMLKTARNGILINRFSPRLYFQKGYALYRLEKTNEAIESIRHSVELNPNDAYVNNFLGLLYLYTEDYRLAEASFLKANIYSPNNVVYMINLAATYERNKNYNSALQIYEDVYKLDKNYKDVSSSIIRVKTLLGFTDNKENRNPENVENIKTYEYNEDEEVKTYMTNN